MCTATLRDFSTAPRNHGVVRTLPRKKPSGQEKKDDQNVKEVKANKDLSALQTSNWMVALDKDMKTQMLVEKSPARDSARPGSLYRLCSGRTPGTPAAGPAGPRASQVVTSIMEMQGSVCIRKDIEASACVSQGRGHARPASSLRLASTSTLSTYLHARLPFRDERADA